MSAMVISTLIGYLIRLTLTRNLTVEEYGLYYAAAGILSILAICYNFGFMESITRQIIHCSERRDYAGITDTVRWSSVILYGVAFIVMGIAALLADLIASMYLHNPAAAPVLQLFFLSGVFFPLDTILPGILFGMQRIPLHSGYSILRQLTLFIAILLLVPYGIIGAAAAQPLALFAMYLIGVPLILHLMPKSDGKWRRATPRKLFAFGIPILATSVISIVLSSTDTLFLAGLSTLEQTGYYQAALPLASFVSVFGPPIGFALYPTMTVLWKKRQHALIAQGVTDVYRFTFMATTPIVLLISIYARETMNIVFGADYLAATMALQLLAYAYIAITFTNITGGIIASSGNPQKITKITVFGALINIPLNILLVPRFGATGAAIAMLIASGSMMLLAMYALQRMIAFKFPYGDIGKTLLAGAGAYGTVRIVQESLRIPQYAKIVCAVALAGMVYLLLLFLLRAITVEELKEIRKRVGR
jgi:stage V sporulation protein B